MSDFGIAKYLIRPMENQPFWARGNGGKWREMEGNGRGREGKWRETEGNGGKRREMARGAGEIVKIPVKTNGKSTFLDGGKWRETEGNGGRRREMAMGARGNGGKWRETGGNGNGC